jgi:hypothetical protein
MPSSDWNVQPGDTLSRVERKDRFGGSVQAGIAHSTQTPNICIYTDPDAGSEHGYEDHWDAAGENFVYTGEGQEGDQAFDKSPWGNRAVRDHKETGRAIRLFEAAGTQAGGGEVVQRYVGRLEIDDTEPYSIQSGPDKTHAQRDIIVFKLHRVPEGADEPRAGGAAIEPNSADRRGAAADPARLLAELPEIRVDVHDDGRRVPYKFVVLLWAISEALPSRDQKRQRFRFQEVSGELAALLKPFQVSASRPDPRNPWFALKETPMWWDLDLPDVAGVTYKQTRELNLEGGLSRAAFELVVSDADFASRAIQTIVNIVGDSPEVRDLVTELRLDGTTTPGEQPPVVRKIPVESHVAEDFAAEYNALGRQDRTRKEAKLQKLYEKYLKQTLGHKVCRHEIRIDSQVLYTDLFDETTDELIEVKSSIERSTMRLALGQVLDYALVLRPKYRSVLVPERPARSVINLFHQYDVGIVWRSGDTFSSSRPAKDPHP